MEGDNGEVSSPVVMWVKAMDLVLDKLRVAGTDFSAVAAVSGSGQQHGSVWWRKGTREVHAACSSHLWEMQTCRLYFL